MPRKSPLSETLQRLYRDSGNQCAYPGCHEMLWTDENINMSVIAHIEAAEEGGPRFNPNSNDEQRRSYENLIPMCIKHSFWIDKEKNRQNYTVQKLKELKANHKNHVQEQLKSKKIPKTVPEEILIEAHTSLQSSYSKIDNATQEIKEHIDKTNDATVNKIAELIKKSENHTKLFKSIDILLRDYRVDEALVVIEEFFEEITDFENKKKLIINKLDCLVLMKKKEAAKEFIKEMMSNNELSKDLNMLYQQARINFLNQDFDSSLETLELILDTDSNNKNALALLIAVKLERKEFNSYTDAIRLIPKLEIESNIFKFIQADIYYFFKIYDKSLLLSRQLFEESDNLSYAFNYFSKVLNTINQPINRILGLDEEQTKLITKCYEQVQEIKDKLQNKSILNYSNIIFEIEIETLALQKNFHKALSIINTLINKQNNNRNRYIVNKAQILISLDQCKEAEDLLSKLSDNELSKSIEVLSINLQISIFKNDFKSAEVIFNEVFSSIDSKSLEVFVIPYFDFVIRQNNFQECKKILNLIDCNENPILYKIKNLELLIASGEKEDIDKEYEPLITHIRENFDSITDLDKIKLAYFFRNNSNQSNIRYEKAILASIIDFENDNIFLARFIQLTLEDDSLETVSELLSIVTAKFPNNIEYFKHRISFLHRIGSYHFLIKLIESSKFADDIYLAYMLAFTHISLNNKKAAKSILNKKFNLNELSLMELFNLATLYFELDKKDLAEEIILWMYFKYRLKDECYDNILYLEMNYRRANNIDEDYTLYNHRTISPGNVIYLKFSNEHNSMPYLFLDESKEYLTNQEVIPVLSQELQNKLKGKKVKDKFVFKEGLWETITCTVEKSTSLLTYIIVESFNKNSIGEKAIIPEDKNELTRKLKKQLKAQKEFAAKFNEEINYQLKRYKNGEIPIYTLANTLSQRLDFIDLWNELSRDSHLKIVTSSSKEVFNDLNKDRRRLYLNKSKTFILDFLSLLTLFSLKTRDKLTSKYNFAISTYLIESLNLIMHKTKAYRDSHLSLYLNDDGEIVGSYTEPKTKKVKFLEKLIKWTTKNIQFLTYNIPDKLSLKDFERFTDSLGDHHLASHILMGLNYRDELVLVSDDQAMRKIIVENNSLPPILEPLSIPTFFYDLYCRGEISHSEYFQNIEKLKNKNYCGLKQIYLCEAI